MELIKDTLKVGPCDGALGGKRCKLRMKCLRHDAYHATGKKSLMMPSSAIIGRCGNYIYNNE